MAGTLQPAYEVDATAWPIVALRPTPLVGDQAALDRTYLAMDAVLARKERFAVMLDLRGAVSSAARRKRFSDWVDRNGVTIRTHAAAVAVIAGSTVERGFVTAALWFMTPPIAMRVFTDEREAEPWLHAELHKR